MLAQYFLEEYSKELGKDVKKISAYALDILRQYPFPGNVRELENIIERSIALESSNIILPDPAHFDVNIPSEGINLDQILSEIERDYILKSLEIAHGSKQRAAHLLGVTMRSFRYRLEKLGLSSSSD